MTLEAVWHDVECGGYAADLDVWDELAARCGGPILDLGAGSGRVSLRLAAAGYDVCALDVDPELVAALAGKASELKLDTVVADARTFTLGRRFRLIIAPMQVTQLLGGEQGRRRMLARAHEHLVPGGVLAAALADPFEAGDPSAARPPLPDVLERDGWVYSSTPVAMRVEREATAIDRLRSAVSPAGELTEAVATIVLDAVEPAQLEAEARQAGFAVSHRLAVPATNDYVGSTVVVLER